MFCSYLRGFNLIKILLEIKSDSPVAKLAVKVDVNLLYQNCEPAEWLADWLTDLLRHLYSQGTRTIETLKALGHSRHLGTWSLEALGHLKSTWVLRHSRHFGTRALERHLGNWAPRHSGTWALKALKALYLADSSRSITSYLLGTSMYHSGMRISASLVSWFLFTVFCIVFLCYVF